MKRTKEEALKTREKIIEKAVALFLVNGFSKTTLNQIAQKAGVTRGAIYWHFDNKLDIINDLIDHHSSSLFSLIEHVISKNISEIDKIEELIEIVIDNFYNNRSFKKFIELTWFKMEYTNLTAARQTKGEFLEYFISIIEKLVIAAQHNGAIIKNIDAHTIALTITNQIIGMYRLHFLSPKSMDMQQALSSFEGYLSLLRASPTINPNHKN